MKVEFSQTVIDEVEELIKKAHQQGAFLNIPSFEQAVIYIFRLGINEWEEMIDYLRLKAEYESLKQKKSPSFKYNKIRSGKYEVIHEDQIIGVVRKLPNNQWQIEDRELIVTAPTRQLAAQEYWKSIKEEVESE